MLIINNPKALWFPPVCSPRGSRDLLAHTGLISAQDTGDKEMETQHGLYLWENTVKQDKNLCPNGKVIRIGSGALRHHSVLPPSAQSVHAQGLLPTFLQRAMKREQIRITSLEKQA